MLQIEIIIRFQVFVFMNIQVVSWAVILYSPSLLLKLMKMEAAFLQNVVIHVQEYTCHNPEDESEEEGYSLHGTIFCKKMVFA